MSENVILITLIANLLFQPLLQYLLSSKCKKIKCGCIECDRVISEKSNQNDIENNNNNN
jgi:hypothetical protein